MYTVYKYDYVYIRTLTKTYTQYKLLDRRNNLYCENSLYNI